MSAQPSLRCPTCGTTYEAGSSFCAHDGAALVTLAGDPLIGSVLAERYRIVRLLGEGGMGRVYEAQHVNINKRLAIKVLRPEVVALPQTVARFRQEARSASSIGHENIIDVDDFATLPDGSVYLAMEFLEGESLGDRMRAGPLPFAEAVEVMVQVCRGLAAAHDKGITHRDMKPENIFLARKGGRVVPKILDFGIAKVSGDEGGLNLTQTGAIFGTPLYMSPEQAKGQATDFRTDVYSVGVILYEVFTGQVPFRADSSVQVLNQHITADPARPTVVAPERAIPLAIEAVILRAMAKEPAARQESMRALGDALGAAGGGRPAAAIPVTATAPAVTPTAARGERAAARSRTPLFVGGGAAVVVLLAIVVWLARPATVTAPVALPPAPGPLPAPAPAVPAPPPPAPPTGPAVDVILSSVPPRAKIVRDGVAVGETPDTLKVPDGATVTVTVRKDGYVDQVVQVNPQKGHKLLVKLDKERRGKPATGGKTDAPPAAVTAAPAKVAAAPAKAAPPPPARPAPPSDAVAAQVERYAAQVAPGAHRVAPFSGGAGVAEGQHGDWYQILEPGKCYSIVAAAGPGVDALYLYLWGPDGKRATGRQEGHPNVMLQHCATNAGSYHFQVKVARGRGDYKVSVYQR